MPRAKKPIMVDGVPHRLRRGKLVPIPEKWLGGGHLPHDQTMRKRPSQALHKFRKDVKHGGPRNPKPAERGDP